jgi:hypothetical protein
VAAIQAKVKEASEPLRSLQIDVARRYLDGEMSREEAQRWLVKYNRVTPQEAERGVRFMEHYRSYVINYSYGEDLVRAHVDRVGRKKDASKRWAAFLELLSNPTVPTDLVRRRDDPLTDAP